MKKIVFISALLLTIASSVLAGTLANYTITLDDIATGSVVGKEFVFLEDGTDTFSDNIKIAPTETVTWQFAVKNYDGGIVTETDLYYDLAFEVAATPGKTAIAPLTVTVKDEGGATVGTVNGTGILHVDDEFALSATGQSDSYIVEIYWPSTANDIDYAGGGYGTSVRVSAVATQIPGDPGDPGDPEDPEDPEDPGEPPVSDISVLYEAGSTWGTPPQHNIRFTVTNNSTAAIANWSLEFFLQEDVDVIWNARLDFEDPAIGKNRVIYPDQWHTTIEPGQSVTFTGQAKGPGSIPITGVTLNGAPASVECRYIEGNLW